MFSFSWFVKATSPDEEALIIGAARIGFVISTKQATDGGTKQVRILLKQKTPNDQVGYKTLDYFVDAVIPFDFERKRMTVMARHPDGSCHIHSKGAESSILASEVTFGAIFIHALFILQFFTVIRIHLLHAIKR